MPDSAFEPRLLFGTPDCLIRAIGHYVGTAKITPLDQPNLEVLSPAKGPPGSLAHWYLLEEYGLALLECKIPHKIILHAWPAIVPPRVMVVLDEIASYLPMKFDICAEAVCSLPMPSGQLYRLGQLVVVDYVAGMDEEARVKLEHLRIYFETTAGNILVRISLTG
ncbi:hypothetical protein ES703_88431 [subsurface metagenome]